MIAPARLAALDILEAVSAGRMDLPAAIARVRGNLQDERDRALAAEIATGVQRWRAALDHLIVTFSKRAVDRLDPEIVEILRLSTYQLLHLTRVPAAAVVDDAVNLAKRAGKKSASGFVNAVLRAISRQRHALPLPPRPDNVNDRQAVLDYFATSLSHPRWLVARWFDRFGFEATERWLQFNNTPAPLTLRVNRLKLTSEQLVERLERDDIRVSRGRFAPHALFIEEGHPLRGSGVAEGWFVVQDEASQLVTLLAGSAPGPRVLDTCASPGGKTTALAATMDNKGLVVASDVRGRRIELLRRTVSASGATNVHVVQADLMNRLPFSTTFDTVFVDAPCSGLGTLRRDPDIRWRRREDDLAVLASAQLVMLRNAAECVAPGGRLVYATCSSEPEENEAVVEGFLDTARGFAPVDAATTGVPAEVVDDRGQFRTAPHLHGLEGFYGAVFQRGIN